MFCPSEVGFSIGGISQLQSIFRYSVFMSSSIKCLDCHFEIDVEGGEIGDYLECETCACEMILSSIQPPKVQLVVEEK